MRNLIRCKLRNDGPLTITQRVNKLAPSSLSYIKDMTFFSWKMYSDKIIACYFKAFCRVKN